MIVFEADKKPLHFLLEQIQQQQLALPDFQRSFVWNPENVRELIVSILSSYPAGTLLLLQGGATVFKPREFESAPSLNAEPPYLVLDGQQRLTSLYQAFAGTGETHRFFLNVSDLLRNLEDDEEFDLDEAVEVYPVRKAASWDAREQQALDLMLPLERLRYFDDWKDHVVEVRRDEGPSGQQLRPLLNQIGREVVRAFDQYMFPVTTLSESTPAAAVCSIFETLNRTGVKLSVFELLTARAYASGHRLRDMWEASRVTYPILEEFGTDPYEILQVIALRQRPNAKRGQVLSLGPDEIAGSWENAASSVASALSMLQSECGVLAPRWVPYGPAVVTMAVAWPTVEEVPGPEAGARRARLRRWFWVASFGGRYDNAANTMMAQDKSLVRRWLEEGIEPPYMENFAFEPIRWRDVTPRQRAVYRATMALLMQGGPMDFHKGRILTQQIIDAEQIDDHHIFPVKYVEKSRQSGPVDCILNRTLIDRYTNIRISAKAPSKYLGEMEKAMGQGTVRSILRSHHLPDTESGPLLMDDFEGFLAWRQGHLARLLGEVTSA